MATQSTTARPRRDDVRSRVIEAASELFTSKGYVATTLADIATTAGFTKGAIYSNFGGKPDLFVATLTSRFRSRTTEAVAAAAGRPSRTTAVLARQLAEIAVSDVWAVQQAEFALLARTDQQVAVAYEEIRRLQVGELAAQLRTSAQALNLRQDVDAEAAALLLIITLSGAALEHALSPDAMPVERIEAVFTQVITGLRP